MSVLRLLKDLIGAEDVNWGDSSSTFNRETHLGGTVAIRYIDAEAIPSTGLGGYVGDHLHEQNTDSLTTSVTFGINAAGTSVVLDASGLTASRTFSFPDTSDQELVGATDLSSTSAGLGAATVGVEDSGGYFSGSDVEAITQELGEDVDTLINEEKNKSRKSGFKLGYSSDSAITITGGMWGHSGTADQYVYMNSSITFTLGPAGSNGLSDTLGADELHYIYIDDSAIVAGGSAELTASEFINSTDIPSYSNSKHGWYASGLTNTAANDRCIGAVLTDTSGDILAFAVHSNTFYRYSVPVAELTNTGAGTTYSSLNLTSSVPSFSSMVKVRIINAVAGTILYFDTSDSGVTPEAHVMPTANAPKTLDVSITTSQLLYYYGSADNNINIDTVGYFIDEL